MSSKENMGSTSSNIAPISVKPEPEEYMSPTFSRHALSPLERVKNETQDALHESSPVASNQSQGVLVKQDDSADVNMAPPTSEPALFATFESATEIDYSPEASLRQGLGMVNALKSTVKTLKLGSKLRVDVWDRELKSLESQTSPTTLIAVCGATGAGKSSILNAILDDNIVPTSGMRACTAVVTEISYHDKSAIEADVSFLTMQEWKAELEVLLADLVDEDGSLKRTTDLKTDSGVAWSKVHAVYPRISQEELVKLSANEIIARDPRIASILSTTKTIVAKDSKQFATEIAKYIDSKDQSRGKKTAKKTKETELPKEKSGGMSLMDKVRAAAGQTSKAKEKRQDKDDPNAPAYWPLIKNVRVRCKVSCLSTGAVLVDLPGVADANAARNSIAQDYMKKCQCIWVLAPIFRAVDDKTARDLLGDAFKHQLMMDGNYDAHTITFIASKCDDISCSEVIRALHLEDEPELEDLEEKIQTNLEATSALKQIKAAKDKIIKGIESQLKYIRPLLKEYEEHLFAHRNGEPFKPRLTSKKAQRVQAGKKRKHKKGGRSDSPKRRRSDNFGENGDDEESEESDSDSVGDPDEDDETSDAASDDDSDGDQDDQDGEHEEEATEESLQAHIDECKKAIKEGRASLNPERQEKKEAVDALGILAKSLTKLQREKNAFCSLKRSEFSRDVLKEDFRTGLKNLDDEAALQRDPDNFDPSQDLRDYDSIDLPVFTCSSRDYVRLKGQIKGDGEPSCFSNVDDTGVPALQEWCHQLTLSSRQRSARAFFAHLRTFATTVETYVRGIGDVTEADRAALREKWSSSGYSAGNDPHTWNADEDDPFAATLGGQPLYSMPQSDVHGNLHGLAPRLAKSFSVVVDKSVEELQNLFKEGLEAKCHAGAASAAESALDISDSFASSMHWGSYRATLRRHGSFRRDLNNELLAPFTKTLAVSWANLFDQKLFAPLEKSTIQTITDTLNEVEASAAIGLRDKVQLQATLCFDEAKVALKKTLDIVQQTMQDEQKEVSRCLAPHVQSELVDGYDTAMLERGTGSVARQKASFRSYLAGCKDEIFEDGGDTIMTRLNSAADNIGHALDNSFGELAQKIEVNLAVLWETVEKDPHQAVARVKIVSLTSKIQGQINLWVEAEKTKREEAERVARQADEDVEMN